MRDTRQVIREMMLSRYDHGIIDRQTWLKTDGIAEACALEFGPEVPDTDKALGEVSAWLLAQLYEKVR